MPRPPPPNAALMISGIADLVGDLARPASGLVTGSSVPGTTRNAGLLGEAAGGGLVAQQFQQLGAGSDEGDAGAFAGARQRGILGEEAVAGMDGVDALFLGQGDDALDIQVGFHGAFAFADQVGFVGLEAVQAEAVFLGIDGDGAQAEFVGGAEDADGDFAAIQGEKFFHGRRAWKIVCFLRITGGVRAVCGGMAVLAGGDPGVAPRSGTEDWCTGLVVVRGVKIGEAGEFLGKFVEYENRISRANRDAGTAIDAVVRFDVKLWRFGETGLILLGVDAVHRAGLHAQFILGTGIGNYVCHTTWSAIPMPAPNSRKQEAKLDNRARVGGA